jgi:methylated-DNA-[protein]-cysteine S-methyltransferase
MQRPPTEFEQRVYEQVRRIPAGRVSTYAAVARTLGCGSAQAVGQALKRNPYAPQVPCHRVIRTDLTLGGYAGAINGEPLRRKRRLLRGEGVEFDREGRLLDEQCCWQ